MAEPTEITQPASSPAPKLFSDRTLGVLTAAMLAAAVWVCFSTFGNPYESKTEAVSQKLAETCCDDTVVVETPKYMLADGRGPLRDEDEPAGARELRTRPMADPIPAY